MLFFVVAAIIVVVADIFHDNIYIFIYVMIILLIIIDVHNRYIYLLIQFVSELAVREVLNSNKRVTFTLV